MAVFAKALEPEFAQKHCNGCYSVAEEADMVAPDVVALVMVAIMTDVVMAADTVAETDTVAAVEAVVVAIHVVVSKTVAARFQGTSVA